MIVSKVVTPDQLIEELRALPEKIESAVEECLDLGNMLFWARMFCPVKSGSLRDTIRAYRISPTSTVLLAGGWEYINTETGKPVDYARYVHDGTSRQVAQPFFIQAVEMEKDNLRRAILEKTAEKF